MVRYSLRLPLLLYGGCLALVLLDIRLLPRLIDGYGGLELEYRPVEQATRLAYLLAALAGALGLRGPASSPAPASRRATRTARLLLVFGLVMVLLENNWDMGLREALVGRLAFAAALGAALLALAWLMRSGGRAPPLLCGAAVALLALGQVADTLHDKYTGGLLGHALVQGFAGLPGIEEGAELLAAAAVADAAWRWYGAVADAQRLRREPAVTRLVVGLVAFGIGNGFLAYKMHGRYGHFVSNEVAAVGVVLMMVGAWVAWRAWRDPALRDALNAS